MPTMPSSKPSRRTRPDTRSAIQQVALDLFTQQGYDATSMREIAEALGIKKASLYHHFTGKEAIVASLLEQRSNEAVALLDWVREQPRSPDLPRVAVLRWIDTAAADKLRGIRFLAANPLLVGSWEQQPGERISSTLSQLVDALARLLPRPTPVEMIQLRVALLSINSAVAASAGADVSDDQILAAARRNAVAVLDVLVHDHA